MLNEGNKICGFTVNRVRENERLHGRLVEMTHDKTGAGLCWVDNGAENKLFSVAFKTVPENGTGVFHILEHSMLCGSEKYPVKDPFLELLKSSMNTFLNAMTYPDKTVYPVSSRNEKDFLNLTSVYLDAVFAPHLTENPNIFYQEGRHLEPDGDGAFLNGVVFNEMKGVMSSVNNRLEYALNELLFPDSCYRFNSGGDPIEIPDLTYDMFVEAYRTFYHPSNALFYLDGDLPLEKTLGMIDGYLSRFEKKNDFPEITRQTPKNSSGTAYYEAQDDECRRDIVTYAKIFCDYDDAVRLCAAQTLCEYLASSNESPLCRAILSAGLAEEVELFTNDGTLQPYIMLNIRNTSKDQESEIKETIRKTVSDLVKNGIDPQSLTACINRMEFNAKNLPEPQALYRMGAVLSTWLYGGDPMQYLDTDGIFASLRKMIGTGEFEKLLSELFLDDNGVVTLYTLPSKTLSEELEKQEAEKTEKMLSQMGSDCLERIADDCDKLLKWQQSEDDAKAAATLPVLSLDDVSPKPHLIKTDVLESNKVKLLYHQIPSNGIVRISVYAKLTQLSLEEISRISVIADLLSELPTEKHDLLSLQKEIKTYIGSLSFDVTAFSRNYETSDCTPCLTAKMSVLEENLDKALDLLCEILTQTKFDCKENIYEIIRQTDEENRRSAVSSGNYLGMNYARAPYSAQGAVQEAAGGYTFIKTVGSLSKNFDSEFESLAALMKKTISESVCRENITIGITSESPCDVSRFTSALSNGEKLPEKTSYKFESGRKTGIKIPGQVGYAVISYDPSVCKEDPLHGSLKVAANIASLSYLWNKVRVEGGAYGAGMNSSGNMGVFCYSFRDPSPNGTLEIYSGISDFLNNFKNSGESLDKYIISTIASSDPLITPQAQGDMADNMYFSGTTDEMRIKTRKEMLETDFAELEKWAKFADKMAQDGSVCVVANEQQLRECGITDYKTI